jgi:predicted dehydrogenase
MSSSSSSGPRVFIIGAGSRGNAYAKAITAHTNGVVVGVSEPIDYKRRDFIQKYNLTDPSLICSDWKSALDSDRGLKEKVDGVVIATLDETHAEVPT